MCSVKVQFLHCQLADCHVLCSCKFCLKYAFVFLFKLSSSPDSTTTTLSSPICPHPHHNPYPRFYTQLRLIKDLSPRDHITPTLKQRHWLPVHARIAFKISSCIISTLEPLHHTCHP